MKLSECKLGEVVTGYSEERVGHIVGFKKNDYDDTIPVVKWDRGGEYGIHHNNIELIENEGIIKDNKVIELPVGRYIIGSDNNFEVLIDKDSTLEVELMPPKKVKPWPDTLEEALEISKYWGFEAYSGLSNRRRYMVVCEHGGGLTANFSGVWSSSMEEHWKGDGIDYVGRDYIFRKFDSAKELHQWIGEE